MPSWIRTTAVSRRHGEAALVKNRKMEMRARFKAGGADCANKRSFFDCIAKRDRNLSEVRVPKDEMVRAVFYGNIFSEAAPGTIIILITGRKYDAFAGRIDWCAVRRGDINTVMPAVYISVREGGAAVSLGDIAPPRAIFAEKTEINGGELIGALISARPAALWRKASC